MATTTEQIFLEVNVTVKGKQIKTLGGLRKELEALRKSRRELNAEIKKGGTATDKQADKLAALYVELKKVGTAYRKA